MLPASMATNLEVLMEGGTMQFGLSTQRLWKPHLLITANNMQLKIYLNVSVF